MGGGASRSPSLKPSHAGLSPRGRGSLRPRPRRQLGARSIPAWAGEPSTPSSPRLSRRVYPRVGGGAALTQELNEAGQGLSPRGRGSRRRAGEVRGLHRSIPAWAGEPKTDRTPRLGSGVYPRVGGGAVQRLNNARPESGLSPRGRGSPAWPPSRTRSRRSIPAWAGEPWRRGPAWARRRVYPRVGGGATPSPGGSGGSWGLSPRGRGSLIWHLRHQDNHGSIPAWAGEPATQSGLTVDTTVYPRVGGGAEQIDEAGGATSGLSPRGRGSRQRWNHQAHLYRSIPAWAGEPASVTAAVVRTRVYPRVGGGATSTVGCAGNGPGLSPRGRGSLLSEYSISIPTRSIPAWAGEPLGLKLLMLHNCPRFGGCSQLQDTPSQSCDKRDAWLWDGQDERIGAGLADHRRRGSILPTSPTPMRRHGRSFGCSRENGAGDEIRTHDPNLGKVVLYP